MTEKMPNAFSVYLDLLRVAAAATVMLSHYPITASQAAITDRFNFGYDAVIVFFVLSGYVISHAVDTKETDGLTYSVNRIARIFPVAAVAVMLSLLLMMWGIQYNPTLYPEAFQLESPLYYLSRTIFFSNELWWEDIRPFGNGPYWSLAFEVWCYVFYGLAMFSRGRWRLALLTLALLVTGPKQWLMLPIWMAGVAAYTCRNRIRPGPTALWLLGIGPVLVFLIVQLSNPRDWSYPLIGMQVESLLGHGLDGAANFGWGWLLAILVAVHLFAVRQLCLTSKTRTHGRVAIIIQQLAAYTFSLYIYHYPLLMFWQATLTQSSDFYDLPHRALIYVAVLIPVFVLGQLVERRKKQFRHAIIAVFATARRMMSARTP